MNFPRHKQPAQSRGDRSDSIDKRRPRRIAIRDRLIRLAVLAALLMGTSAPTILGSAAPPDPLDPLVNNLFARMSVEQRVGQLMLVSFSGTTLTSDTPVARLIHDYHVGGVLLTPGSETPTDQTSAPAHMLSLVNQLQQLTYNTTLNDTGRPSTPFVPLFIAANDDGNTVPMTELPSNMALGATWDSGHTRRVGNTAGKELSAMGINLLLGPSLDVYTPPSADSGSIIGPRSFGGEPWWVGQMARAYVAGIHEGANGRLAVVPRDFPGLGSSDRRPDQEIPVVPRTAEELNRIDLVPFFAVTGRTNDPLEKAEGLQCASIRYQGQNIRTVTRPMCIDGQAFADIMRLDGFGTWRTDGGMVVSDSLGTRAIRRWYNVAPFPHRQVAREALLAGNDMLALSDFGADNGQPDFDNIRDVIGFFVTLYKSDPVIKARVDQAVRRILRQKLKIYSGDLSLNSVRRDPVGLSTVGQNSAELYTIARDAVTLIAPSSQRLPAPPNNTNNIVIFTDLRMIQRCTLCPQQPIIPLNALEKAIVRLYGPLASNQVSPANITSLSFLQLMAALQSPPTLQTPQAITEDGAAVRAALDRADWIVFAMLDVSADAPASDAVKTFLEARPDLVSKDKVVVMAFGAPVYLSSTDISKLTAYYGLYSDGDPFVDASVRALFQEMSYQGALPISVAAVSYDIFRATSPDPEQVIRIVPESAAGQPGATRTALPGVLPTTAVGDTLLLRTEPILDYNGHVVPDGTPVEFTLSFVTEGVQRRQDTTTKDGIARTSFTLTRAGQIHITAASVNAVTSVTFQVTVAENAIIATLQTIEPPTETPRPSPTSTTAPSLTPTSTLSPTATQRVSPTSSPMVTLQLPPKIVSGTASLSRIGPRDFVAALVGLLMIAISGFILGWTTTRSLAGGLRVLLSCLIAGLVGYIYYAGGRLGADTLRIALQDLGATLITLATGLAGLIVGWVSAWRQVRLR